MKHMSLPKLNWAKLGLELLVVFLGVTGGFILQNQKEVNQNKETELKYIAGFIDDAITNIESLERLVESDSAWILKNEYAINQIAYDSLHPDSANELIKSMVFFTEFTEQTVTYQNIINSGNLNLISDYTLKQNIVKYHETLIDYQLLDDYFRNYNNEHFMPFIMTKFDMFHQKLIDPQDSRSVIFKNVFGGYYSLMNQRLQAYQILLEESKEFKKKLDQSEI